MEAVINVIGFAVLAIFLTLLWRELMLRKRERREKRDQWLRSVFASLPVHQAQLISWHNQGYTYQEIARMLCISKEEVLAELKKAFSSMRMQMPEEMSQRARAGWRHWVIKKIMR